MHSKNFLRGLLSLFYLLFGLLLNSHLLSCFTLFIEIVQFHQNRRDLFRHLSHVFLHGVHFKQEAET